MKRIIIETYKVQEIPVTTLAQENVKNRPLVFFMHGFTQDKKEGIPLGYRLAELGFCFVSVDAYMHGERFDERLKNVWEAKENYIYPSQTGLDGFFLMYEIVAQTAKDIDVLIEHFEEDRRANTSKIGLTGLSMGGLTTFYVAANNPKIKAAVPMISLPAFAKRWEDLVSEVSSYEKWARAMAEVQAETTRRIAFIREIDPFEKMKTFCPKPLLMLNGDKDIDVPKIHSVDLYRVLKPLYAEYPERLRLNIYDDVGHDVTSEMLADACNWFCKYLCSGQKHVEHLPGS